MTSADLSIWRVQLTRSLAWALLLGGWVGMGSLSQGLSSGPLQAISLLALWLLALGAFAALIGRLQWSRWLLRGLLMGAGLLAARGLFVAMHGGGVVVLLPALLAWALVVALASAAVRACRFAAHTRVPSPVPAAAAGAALAWLCVGDITDLHALVPRLMLGGLVACALLAALLPQSAAAHGGCRAGLFDCSLPNWSRTGWRKPQRLPVLLASLAMLPMMCGLPWMVSLCRSEAVSPQAVLAVHFAAMFLPALWIAHRPALARRAATACAPLLALGALLLVAAPGASAWWGLALAPGAAWSVAWAAQLGESGARTQPHASPLAGAALNALLALALGLAVSFVGLQALSAWHVALGAVAALSLLVGAIRPSRRLQPR
jgi:hypothetical protein